MRSTFLILILLLAVSCSTSRQHESRQELTGSWELAVFPYGNKTYAELFGQYHPRLTFTPGKRTFTGHTGCNEISGKVHADKGNLRISEIISTKMSCTGFDEALFINTLMGVTRFEVTESKLEMLRDTSVVMVFTRKTE